MNLPSILILAAIAVWFLWAVRYLWKRRGSCGCGGSCSGGCSGKKESGGSCTECNMCKSCKGCGGCSACGEKEKRRDGDGFL